MIRSLALAFATGALVLLGCGASASAEVAPTRADALQALSSLADSPAGLRYAEAVQSADLVAARKQAGVASNGDLLAKADATRGPKGALALLTRAALPFVLSPFGDVAELDAFDGSKIGASAGTVPSFGEPGTVVVATSQEPVVLEGRLLKAGMKMRSGVLRGGGQGKPSYFPFIAVRGDGLVVLTDQRSVARAALGDLRHSRRASRSNAAAIAAETPNARPFLGVIAKKSGCVRVLVATQDVAPLSGQIELTGGVPERRVKFEREFSESYRVTPPQRSGGQVIAEFEPKRPFKNFAIAFTNLLDKGSAISFSC